MHALPFITFIILQRLAETLVSRANTSRLLRRGASEVGEELTLYINGFNVFWLSLIAMFGAAMPILVPFLLLYLAIFALRLVLMFQLGRRFSIRILADRDIPEPSGIFRKIPRPLMIIYMAEVVVAPMVLGLFWLTPIVAVIAGVLLYLRTRIEHEALALHMN